MNKIIVNSAIKYNDGEIITGRRHGDCIRIAAASGRYTRTDNSVQGFVDSGDNFYTRDEAKEIALKAGQIPADHEGTLYSEDLWPGREEQDV